MARRSSLKEKTTEEKSSIKVDLSKVSEWFNVIKSIEVHFRNNFDIEKLKEAASLIFIWREKLSLSNRFLNEQQKKEDWVNNLSNRNLIEFSYFGPYFLRDREPDKIITEIKSSIKTTNEFITNSLQAGVTQSSLISLFTNKVHISNLENAQKNKIKQDSYFKEIPKIENAINILLKLERESSKYFPEYKKLNTKIDLAAEKKEGIEEFEKKHGNVLAKAASADLKSRQRAKTVKDIIERSKDCPYCGLYLGPSPHLDHIYPVAKGGLSIRENLIWCCSTCNSKKSNKGLIRFLNESGFPIDQTIQKLHLLGKHV